MISWILRFYLKRNVTSSTSIPYCVRVRNPRVIRLLWLELGSVKQKWKCSNSFFLHDEMYFERRYLKTGKRLDNESSAGLLSICHACACKFLHPYHSQILRYNLRCKQHIYYEQRIHANAYRIHAKLIRWSIFFKSIWCKLHVTIT